MVLHPTIDDALPALRDALRPTGGAAVLTAPPGTGKTTLVPIALLREAWASEGRIVVLEPRRLATRAAARRMAYLLGEEVGQTVGYRTRDERRVSAATRIEVVTEGILTRRLQHDPELPGTALVIFDEVHERNLPTDLGLALALDARRLIRPDLRILAMSATIDAGKLAALLGETDPAPVITAGGAPFPVATHWFPRKPKEKLEPAIVNALTTAMRREPGDALVFLPGAGEITRTARLLESAGLEAQGVDIRPLYGMLPAAEQDLALLPSPTGRRRVVIATDIAETSLTVEGVRIVVDGGLRRAPWFDVSTGLTRLRTVAISKASAEQRAGRAGRQGPGVVYRLWSKGEHAAKRSHDEPEIRQVDLAGLALELAVWGSDAASLPWLDPPPPRGLEEARSLLVMLGALDDDGKPTAQGRRMADLPLHPRLARMVAAAGDTGARTLALACCLAALLEERDVLRGRPDELPADLATRLWLLADDRRRHPDADGRAVGGARRRADDIARRVGFGGDPSRELDDALVEQAGVVLAGAYPDRIALPRTQPGRFQLRTGTGAWVAKDDPLAQADALVCAELDGDRKEARIRLAAPIDRADLTAIFGEAVEERRVVEWDRGRDELVERIERRLGGVVLDQFVSKPEPGDEVTALLLERVRERGLKALRWSDRAASLAERVTFLHRHGGDGRTDPWPDWSEPELLRTLEEWLAPFLLFAQGRSDLEALDAAEVLGARLDHRSRTELERAAPERYLLRSGRSVELDYSGDQPVLAVRVQELYGTTVHPALADGRVPLLLHLLSPAGRPVQITGDLPGFWAGSWKDVRKDMAGRYPKHFWPDDPATAAPR